MTLKSDERESRFCRHAEFEARQLPSGKLQIEGYAAVFEKLSRDLGGFVEIVEARSMAHSLKNDDQIVTFNHDLAGPPLARRGAGTAEVSADTFGLHYRAMLPGNEYARRVYDAVDRGDVAGSSFTFGVGKNERGERGELWTRTDTNYPLRRLQALRVVELGPVNEPAYIDTTAKTVYARALRGFVTESRSLEQVIDLASRGMLGSLIDGEQGNGSDTHAPLIDATKAREALLRAQTRLIGG